MIMNSKRCKKESTYYSEHYLVATDTVQPRTSFSLKKNNIVICDFGHKEYSN